MRKDLIYDTMSQGYISLLLERICGVCRRSVIVLDGESGGGLLFKLCWKFKRYPRQGINDLRVRYPL
jgi:hypothetical protein